MKAGFGSADITPSYGTLLAGFDARKQVSTGVLDRIAVRALALESGNDKLVWLAFDLLGVERHLCKTISKRLELRFGI
ncbi:MAG: hypothetical protein IK019_07375, partial [Clostridia bacterium]|nr:hypothetical protein [Clostridia bacterium]